MQILITGREQELSCAEAETLFGSIRVLNSQAVSIEQTKPVDINRLGGSIKVAHNFDELARANFIQVVQACLEYIIANPPQKKFNFGFSYYGKGKIKLRKLGIDFKRALQQAGLKPRLVQTTGNEINAASIKYNQLISGYEFLLIESGNKLILARTTGVQDIDSYSKRDYEKPCRDSRVGMLPPKLSQMLINLSSPGADATIIDPFCGTGGLLIEAGLMGYLAEGSDLNQAMMDCTKKNVDWFNSEFSPPGKITVGEASDATLRNYPAKSYVIATEGFLGQNFSSQPTVTGIQAQIPQLKELYIKFFDHLHNQPIRPGQISICMPFWQLGADKIELDIIDDIVKLGYTKSEFTSVRSPVLEYYRQGQYTGRQILIFKSN